MVSKSNHSLCVIVPVFNEDDKIQLCIRSILSVLQKLLIPNLLLIVNDGSTDKTEQIVKKEVEKQNQSLVLISHQRNRGYGAALQTGIQEAIKRGYGYCLFIDSDLTNDPKYIPEFVNKMSTRIDCVKASRYITGGGTVNVPIYRQIISQIGNFVSRNLFRIGIHDCTNGFRMVRLKLLKDIHFQEHDFSMILEELYYLKKKGARFTEFPNTLKARISTNSHFHYNLTTFWQYLKYAIMAAFTRYEPHNE